MKTRHKPADSSQSIPYLVISQPIQYTMYTNVHGQERELEQQTDPPLL